jgi:DNA repair exonuclease SbcCD ATPase subunit
MTAKTQELQAARDLQGALSERLNALRAEASDLMAKQAAMHSERPRLTPEEAAVATVEDQEAERTLVERRNAVSRLQVQVDQAITEQRQRVVELEREASREIMRGKDGDPYRAAVAKLQAAVETVAAANGEVLDAYRNLRSKLPDPDELGLVQFPSAFAGYDPLSDGASCLRRFNEATESTRKRLAA